VSPCLRVGLLFSPSCLRVFVFQNIDSSFVSPCLRACNFILQIRRRVAGIS
jgi:hypothetical protein